MAPNPTIDRAAAVRQAMRTLVARHGLHGASMSAIAKEAGVAQGTAYAHYQSKEQLLVAAYLELKREMGAAACADIEPTAAPHDRFIQVWLGIYRYLAQEPERGGRDRGRGLGGGFRPGGKRESERRGGEHE